MFGRIAAWTGICVALVGGFEGLALKAYPDTLAHGLPTVCYGMTKSDRPVKLGDHYTKAQCDQFLAEDLQKYDKAVMKCVHVPVSPKREASIVSLAYNIGVGATCKSSFIKRLNAGDPKACEGILLYNKASGNVVRGLVRRRQAEYKLCMDTTATTPKFEAPASLGSAHVKAAPQAKAPVVVVKPWYKFW